MKDCFKSILALFLAVFLAVDPVAAGSAGFMGRAHGGAPQHSLFFTTQALAAAATMAAHSVETMPVPAYGVRKEAEARRTRREPSGPAPVMDRLAKSLGRASPKATLLPPNVLDFPLGTEAAENIDLEGVDGKALAIHDPELGTIVRADQGHLTLLELVPGDKGGAYTHTVGVCMNVMIRARRHGMNVIGQAQVDASNFGDKPGQAGQSYSEYKKLITHLSQLELSDVEIVLSVDDRLVGLPFKQPDETVGSLAQAVTHLETLARNAGFRVHESDIRGLNRPDGYVMASLVTPEKITMQSDRHTDWEFRRPWKRLLSVLGKPNESPSYVSRSWPGPHVKAGMPQEIRPVPEAIRQSEKGKVGGALALPIHIRMTPEPGNIKIVPHLGQPVALRLETNLTGIAWEMAHVELWSNRSGRWPDESAGEHGDPVDIADAQGAFEIKVPAERDFQYSFRIWNPRSGAWQYVPLPRDEHDQPVNGQVVVSGALHKATAKELLALVRARRQPGVSSQAVASVPVLDRPSASRKIQSLQEQPLGAGKLSFVFGAMENTYNRAGGEGDYIADVPAHLAELGNHAYVVTPRYGSTPVDGEIVATLQIPIGYGFITLNVKQHQVAPNLTYLFIEDPEHVLFQNKPYEDADEFRGLVESIVLSRAVTLAPLVLGLHVDAFHYNDWQTALGPIYQRLNHHAEFADATSIFITHNIAYKGLFDRDLKVSIHDRVLGRLVRAGAMAVTARDRHNEFTPISLQALAQLPDSVIHQTEGGLEWWGRVALVKGMTWADTLVAVSNGSREDMQLTEDEGGFAFGAEGVVHTMAMQGRLTAVHNGTDFTPARDPNLTSDGYAQFSANDPDVPDKKRQNKRATIAWLKEAVAGRVNLARKAKEGQKQDEVPIYGDLGDVSENDFILGSLGRLTDQKGVDVMEAALERIFSFRGPNGENTRLILGASSEKDDVEGKKMEARLKQLATGKYRGQLLFLNGRVDKASRLYAGVDCFLMPSLWEPGGISNLIANIMGTPVIGSLTGGLIDFFQEWGGVGFAFPKFTRKTKAAGADHLVEKVREASSIFWNEPKQWDDLVSRAAKVNVSWGPRIQLYLHDVYYASLRRLRGAVWWQNFARTLPLEQPEGAPGASRAVGWLFNTNNPVEIGKIEGFWQSMAGLWAIHRAALQGVTNVSDLLQAALPVFLGVVLALFLAHYISGVVVSEHEQARRWYPVLSLQATGTALAGFLGWPLMALGLVVGGPVGLAMVLVGFASGPFLHGWANLQPLEIGLAVTPEGMTAPMRMDDISGHSPDSTTRADGTEQALRDELARLYAEHEQWNGGIGSWYTFMLKAGPMGAMDPEIRSAFLEWIKPIAEVVEGAETTITLNEALTRWGTKFVSFLEKGKVPKEQLEAGRLAVERGDASTFQSWLNGLRETLGASPEMAEALAMVHRIDAILDYNLRPSRQLMIRRKVSRDQVLHYFGFTVEEAQRELYRGQDPRTLPEADFWKELIGKTVGPDARTVRGRFMVPSLQPGGRLHWVLDQLRRGRGFTEDQVRPIATGSHAADGKEMGDEFNAMAAVNLPLFVETARRWALPLYADFSDTFVQPAAPKDVFGPEDAHEVILRGIVAEDIPAGPEREAWLARAEAKYQEFLASRRAKNGFASLDDYRIWLEPFEGKLQEQHFARLVEHWRMREDFFKTARRVRREMSLSDEATLPVTFVTGALYQVLDALRSRTTVAQRFADEHLEFDIDAHRLVFGADGYYHGEIISASDLHAVGATAYRPDSLVFGDDGMERLQHKFGFWKHSLMNVQSYDEDKITATIQRQVKASSPRPPGASREAVLSREESLQAFQDSGLEVGIHTVTGGVAYATLTDKPDELAALAEEAFSQGLTPGLDQIAAVKIVRRNPANDKKPIIFLLDKHLELAEEAAAAGANILDGIGWKPEQVRALRAKYPHVAIISEIAHDSPTVEADFETAVACGVDGVLLKKYAAWTAKFPEGDPLSIGSIRRRPPGMTIVVAGGIFDGKAVTSIRSLPENVIAAVGTNKPQLPEFKVQIQSYAEAAALSRQKRNPPAPGASRVVGWLFGTNNPVEIGKIEGFWQSVAGLWTLQRAYIQGATNVSDLLQAALPVFLGVVLALLLAHYISGVVVSEQEQAKRWNPMLSLKATGTALIGFIGWPLMALGLVVGGPVGLIMILAGFAAGPVLHWQANRSPIPEARICFQAA